MVGKPPHTSLNDHERLRCFARSFRAFGMRQLLYPTFSHRGDMQAYGLPRNTIRPARGYGRSSCRNPTFQQAEGLHGRTAKSAEKVASPARAPGAGVQTTATGEGRGRLRALPSRHSRSGASFCAAKAQSFVPAQRASDDDTRSFSPCLTFRYFWVKPKVRRKTGVDLCLHEAAALWRRSLQPAFLGESLFSCSFFRRKSQRRPRGENDRESAAHLAERSRKTTLIARSFRALGVRRLLRPTFSHRGIMQAGGLPRNRIREIQYSLQKSAAL